ncbi:phosphopantetheine-binding protein [Micromonospora sp. CNB394]|uniref:phosphopantetheine-binding protein n=1 Tax=Micromonospora sp. CNB394 TaxID=1169151 RepID=UPI00037F02C1|nr:phosphopantetheine-binding protein [Micromonospora sp. CNB394]
MTSAAPSDLATRPGRRSCHAVEATIREVWSEHFGRAVGPDEDFYDLGGDSISVVDVVVALRALGLEVRASAALRFPTPARLAESLTVGAGPAGLIDVPALRRPGDLAAATQLHPIRSGTGVPLIVVHSVSHVEAQRDAVRRWATARPAYGLTLPGGPHTSISALADHLRSFLPGGPLRFLGFGPGAAVATELARRYPQDTEPVVLIDPPAIGRPTGGPGSALDRILDRQARRFGLDGDETLPEVHAEMERAGWFRGTPTNGLPQLHRTAAGLAEALDEYHPEPFRGPAVLFHDASRDPTPAETWAPVLPDAVVHRRDYGICSPRRLIDDPLVATTASGALS